ncbi:MAG: hypothetical protein KC425_15150 [Anaerolineales bacterium]|nr:hypothetical protein [Anaerolineales bacterium]
MRRFQLEENERKILETLAHRGAMSPSQVSAETWMMPGETLTLLRGLSNEGLVLMRGDTNSPDGMLVAITTAARSFIAQPNGIVR